MERVLLGSEPPDVIATVHSQKRGTIIGWLKLQGAHACADDRLDEWFEQLPDLLGAGGGQQCIQPAASAYARAEWAHAGVLSENKGQGLILGVEVAASGRLVGDVVLFLRSNDHAGGEIGYGFHPGVAGQGYAAEACAAVFDPGLRRH